MGGDEGVFEQGDEETFCRGGEVRLRSIGLLRQSTLDLSSPSASHRSDN